MSLPKSPDPAKLVIGMFLNDRSLARPAAEILVDRFGPVDMVSAWFPFDWTSYYEAEMGGPLYRRMFAFRNLIGQGDLAGIKLATNRVELDFSENENRRLNLDPGYLVSPRFVLATGKDFTHRIYIGKGIYADLTLVYSRGRFEPLPWTYPDYADRLLVSWLNRVRSKYLVDMKNADQTCFGPPG